MRRLFTTAEAHAQGISRNALAWGVRMGRWHRIERGIYADGPERPSALDRARARVLASGGVSRGNLAGGLHKLDSVQLDERPTRRGPVSSDRVVVIAGVPSADGLQTLIDLAATLDDDTWEQALESALRKKLTTVDQLSAAVEHPRRVEAARIRRVLARRPPGAPATGSLLETLAVQLARTVPDLPEPVRQYVVYKDGVFVARVDLAWPGLGLFLELDGQQHEGQPVYDARRETAVVAATGWLCGRFTWHEIVAIPRTTGRRLAELAEQCRRRPLIAS